MTRYQDQNVIFTDQNLQGGVMPVGQIEPLNDYQKEAITMAAGGYSDPYAGHAQQYLDDMTYFLNQGTQYVDRGAASMTDQAFTQGLERYMNPYQDQVINSTVDQMRRQAEIDQSNLNAIFNDGAFGSSSHLVNYGQMASDLQRNVGDAVGALNYQGYNQAVNNALGQFNQDANRSLTAGSILPQYASTALSGMDALQRQGAYDYDIYRQNLDDLMTAGNVVQNQNQALLDVVRGEIQGVTDYPYNQLAEISNLLGPFSSGTSSQLVEQQNPLSTAGGALMFLGSGGVNNQFDGLF